MVGKRTKSTRVKTTRTKRSSRPSKRRTAPKKRGRRPGRYILLAVALFVIGRAAAGGFSEYIRAHPLFMVRHVEVTGSEYIDPGAVAGEIHIPPKTSVFDVDLAAIAGHLEETFNVETFTVYRRLPDGIAVRVNERTPVALINAGELVGVDADGVPLPHVGASYVESLPILTGVGAVSSLGDSLMRERVKKGIGLLREIERSAPGIYRKISEVHVADTAELGISLIDTNIEVIIGEDGWKEKVGRLEKVVDEVSERLDSVRAVDIRFGEKIFVRK